MSYSLSSARPGSLKKGMKITLPPIDNNLIQTSRTSEEEFQIINKTAPSSDMSLLIQIKGEMEKLLNESYKIIRNSETTPDVQTTLTPIISQLAKSFEIFYRSSMHYFRQQEKMRSTVKVAQVISSSSVKIPVENFQKEWAQTQKVIDIYADSHPPPHAHEIENKFRVIQATLSQIQNANDKRKSPDVLLQKTIGNVIYLCENLQSNINGVFEQPAFPHFETDLLSNYINDINSFKNIVSDAFGGDFLRCGIQTSILLRLKANLVSDVQSIIDSLKAAFAFPDQLIELKRLKDILGDLLNVAFQKLSTPFKLIKPLPVYESKTESGMAPLRRSTPVGLRNALELESLPIPRDDYSIISKMRKNIIRFFHEISPYIGDIKEHLDDIEEDYDVSKLLKTVTPAILSVFQNNKMLTQQVNVLQYQTKEDIELYSTKKKIMEQKMHEVNQLAEKKNQKCQKVKAELKQIKQKDNDLIEELTEVKMNYESCTKSGDPLLLRCNIRKRINDLNEIFMTVNDEDHPNEDYNQLTADSNDDDILQEFNNVLIKARKIVSHLNLSIAKIQKNQEFISKVSSFVNKENNVNTIELYDSIEEKDNEKEKKIEELKEEIESIKQSIIKAAEKIEIKDIQSYEDAENKINEKYEQMLRDRKNDGKQHEAFLGRLILHLLSVSEAVQETHRNDSLSTQIEEVFDTEEKHIVNICLIIMQQVKEIKPILDNLREQLDSAQSELEQTKLKLQAMTTKLNNQLDIHYDDIDNVPFQEVLQNISNAIQQIDVPFKEEIEKMKEHQKDLHLLLSIDYNRLCAVTKTTPKLFSSQKKKNIAQIDIDSIIKGDKSPKERNETNDNEDQNEGQNNNEEYDENRIYEIMKCILNEIGPLLNSIQDTIERYDIHNQRGNDNSFIMRQCLERLYVTYKKETDKLEDNNGNSKEEANNVHDMHTDKLVDSIYHLSDMILSPAYSDLFMKNDDIISIISPIFPSLINGISNPELHEKDLNDEFFKDPHRFLVGVRNEYMLLYKSISSLTDFFNVVSQEKKKIDEEGVSAIQRTIKVLHETLYRIAPNVEYHPLLNTFIKLVTIIEAQTTKIEFN